MGRRGSSSLYDGTKRLVPLARFQLTFTLLLWRQFSECGFVIMALCTSTLMTALMEPRIGPLHQLALTRL